MIQEKQQQQQQRLSTVFRTVQTKNLFYSPKLERNFVKRVCVRPKKRKIRTNSVSENRMEFFEKGGEKRVFIFSSHLFIFF